MPDPSKRWISGSFPDEGALLAAVRRAREEGIAIVDAYTPYPVHGLDEAMGVPRSRLGLVTLAGGAAGLLSAVALQVYTAVYDWPLDVGGKPANSALAFLPISFELTVLVAGLSTAAAFVVKSRLHPPLPLLPKRRKVDRGVTNDAFVLVLERAGESPRPTELLRAAGAREIRQEPAR
jgi:hypothetical protein